MRRYLLILPPLLLILQGLAEETDAPQAAWYFPAPEAIEAVPQEELLEAWQKGRDFLLANQHPDGHWGSARRTKQLNIWAPVPGAHRSFRTAVTALCLKALLESPAPTPAETAAAERAANWLLEALPEVRRPDRGVIYNIWAHAYGIQALLAWKRHKPASSDRVDRVISEQIDWLQRYESVDGGWAYYDFRARTRSPSGHPNSFVTAAILIALHEARQAGFDVPEPLTDKAMRSLLMQAKPDFTYLYSLQFRFYPMREVNRPGGSLSRSLVCNLAREQWADPRLTAEVKRASLNRFIGRHGWLDAARKRPVPHESWFAVAGYYFYFGHYYAARTIESLPAEERPLYAHHLARLLLDRQEANGSWWDFPLYDYHPYYGTAFAMMSLAACLPDEHQIGSAPYQSPGKTDSVERLIPLAGRDPQAPVRPP